MINRTNYERYLVDYSEGKLSLKEQEMVEVFLAANPDLIAEYEAFVTCAELDKPEAVFVNKNTLLKTNSLDFPLEISDFDCLAIGEIEGTNTPAQTLLLQSHLAANPRCREDFEAYKHTKLYPEQVSYPGKERLYKRSLYILLRPVLAGLSAAAAIALLVYLNYPSDEIANIPDRKNVFNTNQSAKVEIQPRGAVGEEAIHNRRQPDATAKTPDPVASAKQESLLASAANVAVEEVLSDTNSLQVKYAESDLDDRMNETEMVIQIQENETAQMVDPVYHVIRGESASGNENGISGGSSKSTLAGMGIRMLNKFFRGKIKIDQKFDENGDLLAYSVAAGESEFYRTVKGR